MLKRLLLLTGFVALAGLQAGVIDDFNRPDAATLGPNWTSQAGGAQIIGSRAAGTADAALLTYNGLSATSAYVDVFHVGTQLQYLALVLAYENMDNNYFLKVQSQSDDGLFHNYAFYYGNNGTGSFRALTSPFSSARITGSFSGRAATLEIDTDFDGSPEQTYNDTYGSDPPGSGVGLGFFGAAQADNFGSGAGGEVGEVPEPASVALMAGGLAFLAALVRRRR